MVPRNHHLSLPELQPLSIVLSHADSLGSGWAPRFLRAGTFHTRKCGATVGEGDSLLAWYRMGSGGGGQVLTQEWGM